MALKMGTCSLLEKVSSLGGARRLKKLLVTFSGFQKPINGLPVTALTDPFYG